MPQKQHQPRQTSTDYFGDLLLRATVLLLLLFAGGYLVWSKRPPPPTVLHAEFLPSSRPLPQAVSRREWNKSVWPAPIRVAEFLTPAYLRPTADGSVALIDLDTFEIGYVSQTGRVRRVGRIPDGAIRATSLPITDMRVDNSGHVWLCGPNGRIVKYDPNTNAWSEPVGDRRAYRLAPLTGGRVATLLLSQPIGIMSVLGPGDTQAASFGEFLAKRQRFATLLDGRLATVPTAETIVYAPNYGGFIAAFNAQGKSLYTVSSVDATEMPKVEVSDAVTRSVTEPGTWRVRELTANPSEITILVSRKTPDGNVECALDIYDTLNGAYLHSRRLPEAATGIAVGADALFTVSQNVVTVWPIRTGS